jgi:hypothetical protein
VVAEFNVWCQDAQRPDEVFGWEGPYRTRRGAARSARNLAEPPLRGAQARALARQLRRTGRADGPDGRTYSIRRAMDFIS